MAVFILGGLLTPAPVSAARSLDPACAGAPQTSYPDRGSGELARAIDCITAYGVSSGRPDGSFGTAEPLPREQMATFVIRVLQRVNGLTLPPPGNRFANEPISDVHRPNVERAAATNPAITVGQPDGRFYAHALVTRGQIATFIVRALRVAGATLPAGSADVFDDDDGSAHEQSINIVASEAVDLVDGFGDGTYRPDAAITRGEVAIILARTLALLTEQGKLPHGDPSTGR